MIQCRAGDNATGFFFLVFGGTGLPCESESANEWRQGKALQHQSYENDAEGQKNNQVALGKGRAIGERLRESDGSSERDHAAHSRPTNDKDAFRSWKRIALMK